VFSNSRRLEYSNFLPDTADGYVVLLPKGCGAAARDVESDFCGALPFLFMVFVSMFLVYVFPQIAMWLPNYIIGNVVALKVLASIGPRLGAAASP